VQNTRSHLYLSILLFVTTALWGIFWLPLRKIEASGIPGIWAVAGIYIVPLIFMIPLAIYRRSSMLQHKRAVTIAGVAIGLALCFYATALLHTSIIRTTLLFYMTPIWATLLAWLILHKPMACDRHWLYRNSLITLKQTFNWHINQLQHW